MPPINGKQEIRDAAGANTTIVLDGNGGDISAGGGGQSGNLTLKDDGGRIYISMRCKRTAFIETQPPRHRIVLDASIGRTYVGGDEADGSVHLRTKAGVVTARLEASSNLWLGGHGTGGDIVLFHSSATATTDPRQSTVHADGARSAITLRAEGEPRMRLDGAGGNLWLGGRGADGDLMLFKAAENDNDNHEKATIRLNGEAGDIVLRNADCAEDFDVAEPDGVEPGSVLVLDAEGGLRHSREPYDRRVAGVVSGAGGYSPGIVLDRQGSADGRAPVALVGKVYCKVDAGPEGIAVGDLLTTSGTPGHAMKASDRSRAFGSVLGKALRSAGPGQSLIPILVALQ